MLRAQCSVAANSSHSAAPRTLVLVVGGVIGRAVDQGVFSTNTGPAYDGWRAWDLPGGEHLDLVRAAILAANAHDSQPWLFRLAPTQVDLYADTARNLGAIDPFRRDRIRLASTLRISISW